MSQRYPIILAGLLLVAMGAIQGSWFLWLLWPGANFLALGIAHVKNAPGILGKRADGSLPVWSWIIFLPLLIYTNLVWRLACWLSREPSQDLVTDDLVLGRRLMPHEVHGEFVNYVDLTAEFPEPLSIRNLKSYQCFPILDGGVPRLEDLNRAVNRIRPGRTLIHCAQGHGRTGLFALALLLKQGQVSTVDEGLQKLQASRPGIRLNNIQRKCIDNFAAGLKNRSADIPEATQPI